jgi:DnaK suppressor protein
MQSKPESSFQAPPPPPVWREAAAADGGLTAEQLAYFRELLEAERDALLRSAQQTTTHLQDYVATPDPSDRASQEEDHSLELRVRDRERKHLHAIDQALLRIRDGSYGWCSDSGEPIGIERLLARPTAGLTREAQERRECQRRMQSVRRHS